MCFLFKSMTLVLVSIVIHNATFFAFFLYENSLLNMANKYAILKVFCKCHDFVTDWRDTWLLKSISYFCKILYLWKSYICIYILDKEQLSIGNFFNNVWSISFLHTLHWNVCKTCNCSIKHVKAVELKQFENNKE